MPVVPVVDAPDVEDVLDDVEERSVDDDEAEDSEEEDPDAEDGEEEDPDAEVAAPLTLLVAEPEGPGEPELVDVSLPVDGLKHPPARTTSTGRSLISCLTGPAIGLSLSPNARCSLQEFNCRRRLGSLLGEGVCSEPS
jgi:hypothetical protein